MHALGIRGTYYITVSEQKAENSRTAIYNKQPTNGLKTVLYNS